MIHLYGFGPAFGLLDVSPFVIKAHTLLRMANQPYQLQEHGMRGAPRGKLPWLLDAGEVVADSTTIRVHLERKYRSDFSGGYPAAQLAVGWAVEKMLEEHCYWLGVHARWADEANFSRVTARLFDRVPWLLRAPVRHLVRQRMLRALHAQGTGRYSEPERVELARRDMNALAGILGERDFLLGATPCAADASAFAFVSTALCPLFDSPLQRAAHAHSNLPAYVARMQARYFPELASTHS